MLLELLHIVKTFPLLLKNHSRHFEELAESYIIGKNERLVHFGIQILLAVCNIGGKQSCREIYSKIIRKAIKSSVTLLDFLENKGIV